MKVIYEVFIEDDDDASLTRIELIFSELTALEKKILEENNFKYEYTNENKIKINVLFVNSKKSSTFVPDLE